MRILFDQVTPFRWSGFGPARRRHCLRTRLVLAGERRSARCRRAEGFAVLVTTDSNVKYQQNLASRRIAIVVLTSTSWPRIQRVVDTVILAIESAVEGKYIEWRSREDLDA